MKPTPPKSKLLPALGYALLAAAVYLGVKSIFGVVSEHNWWMALITGIIVGGISLYYSHYPPKR